MATTYTLISSNVLTSSAASVTFSSIPATYTDLVLRASTRSNSTDTDIWGAFNATYSNYSSTELNGNGSAASSTRDAPGTGQFRFGYEPISTDTSNTFSSIEMYIPSYTVSQNKPVSVFAVRENNATAANINVTANLWRNTASITEVVVYPDGGSFVSGSSFYLYGIKSS